MGLRGQQMAAVWLQMRNRLKTGGWYRDELTEEEEAEEVFAKLLPANKADHLCPRM